jgi:teichuronic acid biosynthesis glycosyltransferase TuaG
MGNLVSVLMPVKTGAAYVSAAVESVLRQDYPDWELLIGINGHPEKSELFYRLGNQAAEWNTPGTARVTVFDFPHCRNKPQASNRLMEFAKGDYIALLDADDLWRHEKLGWQIDVLGKGYDVVGTRAVRFGTQEGLIPVKVGDVTFDDLLQCNHIVNSSAVIRRECAGWDNTDGLDDYPLWLELAKAGKKFYVIREPLTFIRSHDGQHFSGRIDDSEAIRERFRQCT